MICFVRFDYAPFDGEHSFPSATLGEYILSTGRSVRRCITFDPPKKVAIGVRNAIGIYLNLTGKFSGYLAVHNKGMFYPTSMDTYGSLGRLITPQSQWESDEEGTSKLRLADPVENIERTHDSGRKA